MKHACVIVSAVVLALGCRRAEENKQNPISSRPEPTPFAITAETKWKTVEEFEYGWRLNQGPVHFKLELPQGYDAPGDFIRIRIAGVGWPEFVLDNEDGWIEYNSKEQQSNFYAELEKKNRIRSKYALVLPDSPRENDPPLIFFRSYGYGSDPDRLHIIGFSPSARPVLLFNERLDLVEFRDLDGDGHPEIAGHPCYSEPDYDLEDYAPFHVYKIPYPVTGPAFLSVPLSRRYNLQHYYGWAGPDCGKRLAVVLHPPSGGKPLIMNADAAQKLMEGSGKVKK
jgi:hypothetical protein